MPEERSPFGWLGDVLNASADGVAVFRVTRRADGLRDVRGEYANATARAWWRAGLPQGPTPGGRRHGSLAPDQEAVLHDLVAAVAADGCPRRWRVHQLPDVGGRVIDVALTRLAADLVVAGCRDVTYLCDDESLLAAAFEQTAEAQATLQAALDATMDGFAVYDLERGPDERMMHLRLVLINAAGAEGLRSRERDDLVGGDLIGVDLRSLYPEATSDGLWEAVEHAADRGITTRCRLDERGPGGDWVGAWDNTIAPVGRDRVVITWRDVTDDVRRERDLALAHDASRYAATHDPLTGLANRALLHELGAQALRAKVPEEAVALVYVDLDHFKQINDNLGHAAGDCVLRAVAARLANLVRKGDTAARLGGDEFVLLLRGLSPDWSAARFVQRARASLEQVVTSTAGDVRPGASLGVALATTGEGAVESLLLAADQAMYKDKWRRRAPAASTGVDLSQRE
jgi:diguanylate cyclase (GGDEF)-like protein